MPKSLGLSPEQMKARRKEWLFARDLRKYGLTPEQFKALFESQNSLCAICQSTTCNGRGWCVDHDHATGKVRGILCGKCNLGIGQLGDTAAAVKRAFDYLTQHEDKNA